MLSLRVLTPLMVKLVSRGLRAHLGHVEGLRALLVYSAIIACPLAIAVSVRALAVA